MAYQSEIEKLESRFREKPEQWFAALADAYRKAGDLDMALDVLKAWIGKRPNYTSGHIVLGRCLLDRGQDADAAEAFENVLKLDMENVIALKSLSEIAERQADLDGAREWLQRLLDVDPMNEDARAALDALGGAVDTRAAEAQEPAMLEAEEGAGSELMVERTPSFELGEPGPEDLEPTIIELERASETPPAPPGFEATTSEGDEAPDVDLAEGFGAGLLDFDEELMDLAVETPLSDRDASPTPTPVSRVESTAEPGEPESASGEQMIEPAELTVSEADVAEVQPIEGLTVDEVSFPVRDEEVISEGEVGAPQPERIELAAPQVPDEEVASVEGLTLGSAPVFNEPAAVDEEPDIEFVQPPAPEPEAETTTEPEAAAPVAEVGELPLILPEEVSADLDEPAVREPEPVVTETMAELYASQGLYAEARDIYRELLDQDPHDARLRARLQKLDEEAAGKPSADEPARRQRYAASATGGESVRSMLRGLLGGSAAERAPSASRGPSQPSRPQPGGQAPSSPGGADDTSDKADEGFSFDEFFGMPKSGTGEPRGSDDDDGPEDGFRDWLKGLRK